MSNSRYRAKVTKYVSYTCIYVGTIPYYIPTNLTSHLTAKVLANPSVVVTQVIVA